MKKMRKKILIIMLIIIIYTFFQSIIYASTEEIFTSTEQTYIEQYKEIYIAGNTTLEPVEFYEEGTYKGILPELFKKISDISGITFHYINQDENWQEYAKNNQVEIVSGIEEGTNLEEYHLRNAIDIVKFPINDEDKMISIAFTEIADEELISIIQKSLEQIDTFEKQDILISNIMTDEQDMRLTYILILLVIFLLIVSFVFYLLYRKYKKETITAKYIDNITHLGNYQLMEKHFDEIITDENRTSYCIVNMGIDISHIEEIYGYGEVEKILKDISDILHQNIKSHELFARIYKESFVMMVDFVSEQNITDRITYITNKIKDSQKEKNKTYGLHIYAGIYVLNQTDTSLEIAVYNAMLAKKAAKEQGLLVKMCTKALILKAKRENSLEKEILSALSNNEFLTYVQPLIDVKTKETPYLEALSRWENPKVGLVKPGTFLSIFENNNLIDKLDFQMYENICKMLSKMIANNKEPYTVFCNFSKKTIENKTFIEELDKIAQKYDISKKYIGIILQGNMTNYNMSSLKTIIKKLKEAGFTILLDDFDSSAFSFKEISQFEVDYLKISFKLTDSLDDLRTVDIIRGIIGTLHELNIKVICEDFEKTRQYEEKLKEIGCDILQGNAYYPPIPIEELL